MPVYNFSLAGYALLILLMSITYSAKSAEKDSEPIVFKVVRNPDCKNDTLCLNLTETKLIHVIARQPSRSIHFLLPGSESKAPFSIVMLESDAQKDKLNVNWSAYLSRNNSFKNSLYLDNVRTSYGVILNEFCIYVDKNDDGQISPTDITNQCQHMLGQNMIWQLTDNAAGTSPLNFVYTALNSSDSADKLGRITINVTFPRATSELSQKGGLSLVPGNGVFFEVTIDAVETPDRGRIALIMVPFSQDPLLVGEDFLDSKSSPWNDEEDFYCLHLAQRRTLTEYIDARAPKEAPRMFNHTPAFMQWPMSCEVSADGVAKRRVTAASRSQIPSGLASKYKYSLPFAVYGDDFNQKHNEEEVKRIVGARLQTLSFGSPNDGFYAATNLLRWRGILSMGEPRAPPSRLFNSLIAVGIALLLMLLAVVLATVGVYAYRRRLKSQEGGSAEPLLPPDEESMNRFAIHFPCLRERLRLLRRIPSPQFSHGEEGPASNI